MLHIKPQQASSSKRVFITHKQLFIHTYEYNILSAMLVCLESLDLRPLDNQRIAPLAPLLQPNAKVVGQLMVQERVRLL